MTKYTLFKLLICSSLILLAIACGGGSESNSSAGSTETEVSGSLDFSDTSFSKPRSSSSTSGNVTLVNLTTGDTYVVSFTGNTFGANVKPGDYDIQALRNDNKQVRSLLENVSAENTTNNVDVDMDSTIVAEWIDLFSLEISSLDNITLLVTGSESVLTSSSNSHSDDDRQNALIAQSLKKKLQQDMANDINILDSSYEPEETVIKTFSTNVLTDFIAAGQQVYLAGGQSFSDNTNAMSFNTASLDFTAASSEDFEDFFSQEKVLVITTESPTGALSIIDATSGNITQNVQTYPITDLNVTGYRRDIYVVGRFFADFLERYDVGNPGVSMYSAPYSTLSSSETSSLNPHSLIIASKSQALLTRYGSGVQWLVNPRAASESSFFQNSIDLSAYDTNDTTPEFSAGVFVGGNYYIGAQRLNRNDGWKVTSNAYLAVVGQDGVEVDTQTNSSDNLLGIELPARNPQNIVYNEEMNKIFVQCTGQFGFSGSSNRHFTSGIVVVDPEDFSASLLVDDDAGVDLSSDNTVSGGTYGGLINNVAVVSPTKGYLVIYDSWQNNDLRSFNPTTGVVGDIIADFEGIDIGGLKVDSKDRLWVIANTPNESSIKVLDTSDDSVEMTVTGFTLSPSRLEIIRY